MTDIVEQLRAGFFLRDEAANEIERLRAELAEWKQAASVEAGLRREFLDRAEKAEALNAPAQSAPMLWCCHVRGPDDVHAAPDYETALLWSDVLNEINWRDASGLNLKNPSSYADCLIKAAPAPWPHSAEAHAENLPISIRDFSDPSSLPSSEGGRK